MISLSSDFSLWHSNEKESTAVFHWYKKHIRKKTKPPAPVFFASSITMYMTHARANVYSFIYMSASFCCLLQWLLKVHHLSPFLLNGKTCAERHATSPVISDLALRGGLTMIYVQIAHVMPPMMPNQK